MWIERQQALHPTEAHLYQPRRIVTSGVVAAAFRHRTSRARDPLLRWHVLVANLVEGNDGRWSAFAHTDLYRAARTAGEIFQAVICWRCSPNGVRRHAGDLLHNGRADTPEAAQEATLATRRGKPEREGERLDAGWKREALNAGWGPEHAETLISHSTQTIASDPVAEVWRLAAAGIDETGGVDIFERVVDPEEWIFDLLRRDLTQTSTTFTRFDLTEAIAARLGAGATVATIDRVVARVLASDQVVSVHQPDPPAPRGRARYTSREMLAVERPLLDTLTTAATHPPLPVDLVDQAIGKRVTIGGDQATAVRTLCAATGPVAVLVGPAGADRSDKRIVGPDKRFSIDADH